MSYVWLLENWSYMVYLISVWFSITHMDSSLCRLNTGSDSYYCDSKDGFVWIGLDLFNDDTRPSGHISRPTQVNVSELLSFSKQLLKSNNIVQSGG